MRHYDDVAKDYNAHSYDNNQARFEQVHVRTQILLRCCYHPRRTYCDLETGSASVLSFTMPLRYQPWRKNRQGFTSIFTLVLNNIFQYERKRKREEKVKKKRKTCNDFFKKKFFDLRNKINSINMNNGNHVSVWSGVVGWWIVKWIKSAAK